jgi:hypothetical protein
MQLLQIAPQYVAQAGLELRILPQSPKCWYYRPAPPLCGYFTLKDFCYKGAYFLIWPLKAKVSFYRMKKERCRLRQ